MFGLAWTALLLSLQLTHLFFHHPSVETYWFLVDESNWMRRNLFFDVVLPFLKQVCIICHLPLTAEERVVVLVFVSFEVHSAHDHRVFRTKE